MWTIPKGDNFFPERDDDELKVPELADRPNTGIAFSGGGTRSAAATLGQLRGLNELNLLGKVRYISCVSGGSWACTPFTYLPNGWTDDTFLGQVVPPGDVSMDYLQKLDRNSLAHQISDSIILDNFLKHSIRFAGDETYSRALGDVFLNYFEIDSLKRFFSLNQNSVTAILGRNKNMKRDDFYTVRSGRPFLIVGSTLLRTGNQLPLPDKIHFETTPLYTGSRVLHRQAGANGRPIGGGYIEPFGFDSDEPEGQVQPNGSVTVRLGSTRHRYTLSDVIGASGAAPAEVLAKLNLDWLGFPEFKHWPPSNTKPARAREYNFGDGGHLENLGVMPLLARKVERIIIFVNTKARLKGGAEDQINDSIPPLFGQTPDFTINHVFPKNKYNALVNGLLGAKAQDQTVMFRDTYKVKKNSHFGIEGGWTADVLWIYNERVPAWEAQLPKKIRQFIGSGSMGNFPHFRTFFQNPPAVIDLSAKQVSMLAHLSCWNVVSNAEEFKDMLRD